MTNEELVKKVKAAYTKCGLKPCRGKFFLFGSDDKVNACCPLSALAISEGVNPVSPLVSMWTKTTFGADWANGFLAALDSSVLQEQPSVMPESWNLHPDIFAGWSAGFSVRREFFT